MKPESHNASETLVEKIGRKFFPNLMLHRKVEGLPLEISWRRIFILPTKPGLFFAFVVLLMLIASLNFNNNMGLMMTFLLFGLAQVSLYRVFFNLKGISINQITAKPVFLGKEAEFLVYFKSDSSKFDICLSKKKGLHKFCLTELIANEHKAIKYNTKTVKRGWLVLGQIKLFTSYPFGLFYAWIYTKLDDRCLVYPTPEESPPPLPTHNQSEGETSVITMGEDFRGLKPFQSGDSLRLIAWKRTAQTGELISREFQQIIGRKLLLDFSQVPLASTEEKLSRLTAWVIKSYQQQVDFCLKLPDYNSGFGYSSEHYHLCLKHLALFGIKS